MKRRLIALFLCLLLPLCALAADNTTHNTVPAHTHLANGQIAQHHSSAEQNLNIGNFSRESQFKHTHYIWISLCAILVIFMSIPGITIFYGGLVHHSNVLSIYTQCLAMAAIASIVWVVVGFSLSFGTGDGKTQLLLGQWSLFSSHMHFGSDADSSNLGTLVSLFYQMSFAMISVVIIIGGFAERMKFSAAILFAPIWLIIVYCPIAHWMWGGGWLDKLGVIDFAGGTVVHINAGIAGLVAAIMIGKRKHTNKPHYSLSIVTIGASILWVGWFGFNGGSAHSPHRVIIALINTQLAPAAAGLSWLLIERIRHKRPSARGMLFGVITGLVVITPMAGLCSIWSAIAVGAITSPICYFAVHLKKIFGYDDALDAFGIHGVGGIAGALFTAVFTTRALGGAGWLNPSFLSQLGAQIVSVIAVMAWSGFCTFVILWVINKLLGLRVPESAEDTGLDMDLHGETNMPNLDSFKQQS